MGSVSLFVKCNNCGKDISASSSICPNCDTKQKKIKPIHWVGIVFGLLIFIGIISSLNSSKEINANVVSSQDSSSEKDKTVKVFPKPEKQFEEVITKYAVSYKKAKNELQKSSLRSGRRDAIRSILNNFEVHNWSGKIVELSTNSEGKAILSIRIAPNIEIKTWNNALSDVVSNTLIEQDSKLYKQLMALSNHQQITFSGYFFQSEDDHIKETSMTEKGSMANPEFLMKFTTVTPIN